MHVLVLNCGSSSLKFTVFDMPGEREIACGSIDRIGESESPAVYTRPNARRETKLEEVDHRRAVEWVSEALAEDAIDISGIGHRIVHGGETYSDSVVLSDEVESRIESLSHLAPLHNPVHLQGIRSSRSIFPNAPQVAVFDTAFHQTLPPHAFRYPLPRDLYTKHHIRRYGFHGTSHRYVSERAAEILAKPTFTGVTCHLGNGSSLCAIQDGKALDTSMGLTPLGGVPMGSRSGDLDPAIVLYLQRDLGYGTEEVEDLLNKQSGLLGMSGVSNDLRAVETEARAGNEEAILAIDVLTYQIARSIGGYAALLEDADGIVFTGGIGENAARIRKAIIDRLNGLSVDIDDDLNQQVTGVEGMVSSNPDGLKVLVIPTQEERVIARDTYRLLQTA